MGRKNETQCLKYCSNSGSFVEELIAEGKMMSDKTDDLGDVLRGKIPVHRKEGEVATYSVGGMPIENIAWRTIVY